MTSKLPEEVVKVHEKSLRLLDEYEVRLDHVSEMLRKAVVRLSIVARREDSQLNQILEHIKSSVKNELDLDELDKNLDNLLVEINRSGSKEDEAVLSGLYSCLKEDLGRFDFSSQAELYRARIQSLAEKGPAEREFSMQLLELLNDMATDSGNSNAVDVDLAEVRSFAAEMRASLELNSEVYDDSSVSAILDELADDIAQYSHDRLVSEKKVHDPGTADAGAPFRDINESLIGMLNGMNLPESTRQDHQSICRQLDGQVGGAEQWKDVIEHIAALINKSIRVLQDEKKGLQAFIKKITDQLADIDLYVRQSRQERIDTATESSRLKDSVESNVEAIQESVGSADDIAQLKNNVQDHLSEIRKRVEEHQQAETEREEMSKQGYAHIIGELARTQKETIMLKEQLQESQKKMLRDPLTGLPNRLAYEERIAVEINRSASHL